MSTDIPSQGEPSDKATGTKQEFQVATPAHLSASQPIPLQPEEGEAFSFEEEQPDLVEAFVEPFQLSGAMSTMTPAEASADQSSPNTPTPTALPVQRKRKTRLSLTTAAILVCVVVVVGLFTVNALGQTTPPLQTQRDRAHSVPQKPAKKNHLAAKPTPVPANPQPNGTQSQMAFEWVPQRLPNGWTNAGLQPEDALQAIRTAVAFNDREMSLDYRSVGTRNNHAGTFTAATFVMTAAARQRFARSDVRESSNALFDMVINTKQVRLVVDPQPQLVTFAQTNQQQFAWVDVMFQLWQSQIDPKHPQQRSEGKERDPATNHPHIHHMMVLLLRVPDQNAGNNPAMGGTGWLVSNYALDLPNSTALDIVQPA